MDAGLDGLDVGLELGLEPGLKGSLKSGLEPRVPGDFEIGLEPLVLVDFEIALKPRRLDDFEIALKPRRPGDFDVGLEAALGPGLNPSHVRPAPSGIVVASCNCAVTGRRCQINEKGEAYLSVSEDKVVIRHRSRTHKEARVLLDSGRERGPRSVGRADCASISCQSHKHCLGSRVALRECVQCK